MAVQNTAESIQMKAAVEVFHAIKRHSGAGKYFCARTTIQTLEPYNLKCFDITTDQDYEAYSRERKTQ